MPKEPLQVSFGHAIGIPHEHQAPGDALPGIDEEVGSLIFGDGETGQQLPTHTPEWTDLLASDPGVTMDGEHVYRPGLDLAGLIEGWLGRGTTWTVFTSDGSGAVEPSAGRPIVSIWGDPHVDEATVWRGPLEPIILDAPAFAGTAAGPGFGAGLSAFAFERNTATERTSINDLARLIDYNIASAGGDKAGGLLILREYLIRQYGQEIVSAEDDVSGGLFSDVIVATGQGQHIDGGWGSDVVLADLSGNHTIDATRGGDTVVLTGSSIDGLTTIVVETESGLPTGKHRHHPSVFVVKDADAETATVVKLDQGLYEVKDGDTVAVVQFVNPDGTPADVTGPSTDIFTFVGEFPDPEDSTAARPLLIVAEDIEGEAVGTARSDVILTGAQTNAVNAGAGDDVILHDLAASTVSAVLDGGSGDDTYVLKANQSNVAEIEECLIFDFGGGSLEPISHDTAALLGFGDGAAVSAFGGAMYTVTDHLGTEARVGFEFEDGTALALEEVRAVLLNAEEFDFFRQDGTVLPPYTDSRMTDALTAEVLVQQMWDFA